eukprot:1582518-Rhodomonas_salina.1
MWRGRAGVGCDGQTRSVWRAAACAPPSLPLPQTQHRRSHLRERKLSVPRGNAIFKLRDCDARTRAAFERKCGITHLDLHHSTRRHDTQQARNAGRAYRVEDVQSRGLAQARRAGGAGARRVEVA